MVNLASEPHERRRLARRVAATTAVIVLSITVVHGLVAWRLLAAGVGPEPQIETEDATEALEQIGAWERQTERIAALATAGRARSTADAVVVANDVIARRTFPWGDLFAVLEESLPEDVRLGQVQPTATADGVRVDLVAAARQRARLVEFLEALERADGLREVFPVLQERGASGEWRLAIRARYAGRQGGGS